MEENKDTSLESKPSDKIEEKVNEKNADKNINREIRRRTLKSLAFWGVAAIIGPIAIIELINRQTLDNSIPKPFRKILDLNGKLFKKFVNDNHWVKTYHREKALKNPRTNGNLGIKHGMSLKDFKIQVINLNGATTNFSLDDIHSLPKHEITYSFKCIEGWDMITNWSGALFSDFAAKYKLGTRSGNVFDKSNPDDIADYAGIETPDGEYYVGLDMESALHPQTLLCYEMNGEPLTSEHGAPLRLITPTKYGVKNIKRIGKITFTNTRPRDYWFEQGYDYFAGL